MVLHPSPMPVVETLKGLPGSAHAGLACEYASSGDVDGLRQLVKAGIGVNEGTAYDRRTPLHLAAAAGHLDMARFLIEECGATLQQDRFGLLPIHDAVQNGHVELRRYLQNQKLPNVLLGVQKPGILGDASRQLAYHPSVEQSADHMMQDIMRTVFELVVKEGVFSYSAVHAEVQYFFKKLDFHPCYFEHFTPFQIAKHVHCLIAAKCVALTTEDGGRLDFTMKSGESGFFLTTIGCPTPTEAQKRTEDKISEHLTKVEANKNMSLIFMASEGAAFLGGKERLGIYTTTADAFDARPMRVSDGETSLEILASSRFLKTKTKAAKEQYQIVMEDVVASRRSVIRIVPGKVYPGPYPGGFVLLFGTAETAGRHFFPEISHAMRFTCLSPRRFYLETFANGVIVYSLFFPSAKEDDMQKLGRTIMHSTHLKNHAGRSEVIYSNVIKARISHEVGLYLLAAVKFVYTFFPKEQYCPEYTLVLKKLDRDPSSQRKLEALYKLCMKELLSYERIYDLVNRHLGLAERFFQDFRAIATGEISPSYNTELAAAIDAACAEPQDRQILRMFLTFNHSIQITNFFKTDTPGAFAFRINPAVALKDRPASLYPEMPYAIYLVRGRDFLGFHVRFRDVARGGIRLVLSRDIQAYERNAATLFEECYNLALTQQHKNKDIPEGGAKGVILPDSCWPGEAGGNILSGSTCQSPASSRSCFTRYLNSILDCMLPEAPDNQGIYRGHLRGHNELLFFGPDENTASLMDTGAELAKSRGYPYWKALTTGKSVKLGGVPHDTYGMTTAGVHTYVTELLKELGEDETTITKFQTGGPDGDLGSNEILFSKDKTIAIVDGSGVLYDPSGLHREELTRLAKRRVPVKEFNRSFLGAGGFLTTVEEVNVCLPDGSKYRNGAELRDIFILTKYASADLFVPCGGRPNSVTTENVKSLLGSDGKPKFRMIVEGANLFFSTGARDALEAAGVHMFKDASTNKGGVTSSSLEVFAALALQPQEHSQLLSYNPDVTNEPPEFYQTYVQQILAIIVENAKMEFKAIWKCNRQHAVSKQEATRRLSIKINQITDSIQQTAQSLTEQERDQLVQSVLRYALPPLMIEHLGIGGILKQVPQNYIDSVVAAWLASRFVYEHGINASEVAFFLFMRSLTGKSGGEANVAQKRSAQDSNDAPVARPRIN